MKKRRAEERGVRVDITRWGGEARRDVSENTWRWERSECVDYRRGREGEVGLFHLFLNVPPW